MTEAKGLRAKLTILFVLVALIPTLLAGAHQMYLFYAFEEKKVFAERLDAAKKTSTLIDQYLQDSAKLLEFAADLPEIRDLSSAVYYNESLRGIPPTVDPAKWRTMDALRLTYDPFLYTFIVLDEGTTLMISPYPYQELPTHRNFAYTDWYKRAILSGLPIYSDTFTRVTAGPEVNVVTPIRDGEGRISGLMGASLDLGRIAVMMGAVDAGEGGRAFLVDRFGVTIGSRREELSQFPFVKSVLRMEEGAVLEPWQGEEYLVAYSPIPRSGWGVVVAQPSRYAFARAITTRNSILLATLIGAIIASLAGVLIARGIAGPISRLTEATKAVGRGEPRVLEIETRDEIGELAASFNAMNYRLEVLHAELKGKIRELEEKNREIARLAQITNESADAIVGFDAQGTITSWNKGAEAMFGYKAEEMVGKTIEPLIPEEIDTRREHELITKALTEMGIIKGYETKRLSKDGRVVEVDITRTALKDAEGRIVGSSAILRDITERKRLEEELRRKNQEFMMERDRLHTVLANMGDGLAMVDEEARIQLLNWTFYQSFGPGSLGRESHEVILGLVHGGDRPCPVKELIKEIRLERMEEEARPRKLPIDARFVVTKEMKPRTVEMTSKGGRTYLVTLSAVRNPDGSYAVIEVYKDITERKRMEEELRERNIALEEKSREVENFVYTISHDLKSPLSTLQGFTSLLKEEYGKELGEEGRFYIERVLKNVEKMERLIMDLLELSRIGRVAKPCEEVDTLALVKEVCEELSLSAREKGIRFIIQPSLPTIYCEKDRIAQVFTNLIDNSIKYIGNPQEPFVEVGCEDKGVEWEFYVRDNGIGIPEEYQEKIFKIFQRIQDERTKDVRGTGMGLAIVQKIITLHKGRIWVRSARDKGATIYFTIPKDRKRSG